MPIGPRLPVGRRDNEKAEPLRPISAYRSGPAAVSAGLGNEVISAVCAGARESARGSVAGARATKNAGTMGCAVVANSHGAKSLRSGRVAKHQTLFEKDRSTPPPTNRHTPVSLQALSTANRPMAILGASRYSRPQHRPAGRRRRRRTRGSTWPPVARRNPANPPRRNSSTRSGHPRSVAREQQGVAFLAPSRWLTRGDGRQFGGDVGCRCNSQLTACHLHAFPETFFSRRWTIPPKSVAET